MTTLSPGLCLSGVWGVGCNQGMQVPQDLFVGHNCPRIKRLPAQPHRNLQEQCVQQPSHRSDLPLEKWQLSSQTVEIMPNNRAVTWWRDSSEHVIQICIMSYKKTLAYAGAERAACKTSIQSATQSQRLQCRVRPAIQARDCGMQCQS